MKLLKLQPRVSPFPVGAESCRVGREASREIRRGIST